MKIKKLIKACDNEQIEIVKLLVQEKVNLEWEDENKIKPIHCACRYGQTEIVKLLIHEGVNLECEDKNKMRPVHYVCYNGQTEIVKLLIQEGVNLECEDKNKRRPIDYACGYGYMNIVKLLVDGFIDTDSNNLPSKVNLNCITVNHKPMQGLTLDNSIKEFIQIKINVTGETLFFENNCYFTDLIICFN